jgi:hypothetical protein
MIPMTVNYWIALSVGAVIGAVAMFLAMYSVGFRRVHRGPRTLLVPEWDRRALGERWQSARSRYGDLHLRKKWFHALIAFMTLVIVLSGWQLFTFTSSQRACNDRLWSTIAERAAISEDTERARKENDEAVHTLFTSWLQLAAVPADERRDRSIVALREFESTYAANISTQRENARKRAENSYPKC